MRSVLAPVLLLGITSSLFGQVGSLDPTFDADGLVATDVMSGGAMAVLVQPDGRIILAGGGDGQICLARYHADGTLDLSFDGDGLVYTYFPGVNGTHGTCRAAQLQPDGKIVITGFAECEQNSGYCFALVRYNTDGSLDASFAGDGKLTERFASGDASAYDVVIQPDGKIVAVGWFTAGLVQDVGVMRYNADGSLDPTFSGDGKTEVSFSIGGFTDVATAVALQGDGKIVIAGRTWFNGNQLDLSVGRLHADGTLDSTFSGDGKVTANVGGLFDQAFDVVVQPDGKILVAGQVETPTPQFALLRYEPNGDPDITFDGDGIVLGPIGTGATSVCLQPDGKILATGENVDFVLVRYNTDGSVDQDLNGSGYVLTDYEGEDYDHSYAVALQPDGKIVVGGMLMPNGGAGHFGAARYLNDLGVDVAERSAGPTFWLYPNPARDQLFIRGLDHFDQGRIVDALGRAVRPVQQQERPIKVDGLPEGVYSLVLCTGAEVTSRVFVKE